MTRKCLLLATLTVGCVGEVANGSGNYAVVDSAGVEIVESFLPAWADQGRLIDPSPLVRIGREEEGPYQFGSLSYAKFMDDGTIAVAERVSQQVRLFDTAGRHLRTVGGSGQGPGEFQRLAGVYRYPGDSLAAFDGQPPRTTIFPLTSGESRTILNRVEGNYAGFGVLGGGQLLLYSPGGSYHPELPPGLQWVSTDVIAVDASDGSWRVIASLPGRQQLVEPDGNTRLIYPALYSVHAVAETGFYWGTPDRYEIGFYDGEGALQRIIRRAVEPIPVEPSMVEEWIESNLDRVRRMEGEAAVPSYRASYEDAYIREYWPLFGGVFVDAEGRLWVPGPSLEASQRRWSVFSEDGFWLGDLEAPEGLRIVDSLGDLVLGIWRDAVDVPYVQLHRLVVR